MPKAKKTNVHSQHKDFAAKNTMNPPMGGDTEHAVDRVSQEQDPKRRIGQHSGRGEPPLMKK